MPRLPIDYQKSLIYKLCCNNTDIKDIYIGSTTDFIKRKNCHKTTCNNPNAEGHYFKVYQFIRENNGWDNWSMVLVEKYPCESKLQLKQRERYFIELLESKLNCNIPMRFQKEYRNDNIDKVKEYQKGYYLKNADKIKKKITCECGSTITNGERLSHCKSQKHLKYLEDGIVILYSFIPTNKEKITCECGAEVIKKCLARHRETQKHLKYLEQNK